MSADPWGGYNTEDVAQQTAADGLRPDPLKARHPKLGEDALQGLPGRVVRELDPHTEADPAAVLASFLSGSGAMIGNQPHVFAGDVKHPCRIWPLIIGRTSGGMKGTSWAGVWRVLERAGVGHPLRVEAGLSSAEGLIEKVDDGFGSNPNATGFREANADKRFLVIEPEFAAVLARGKREGSTLSHTLRDAWDGKRLSTITRKQNCLVATDHHIVVVGHITATELRAKLADSDVFGGSMNRLLTVCSKRSKRLPDGGGAPEEVVDALADLLRARVESVQKFERVERDDEANQLWSERYASLTPDDVDDGHYSAVVARAVPQVNRLSLTYALLDHQDGQPVIRAAHLRAALALWEYAQASAFLVFGDIAASVDLNRLCEAVNAAVGQSLTRTEIYAVFGNNKSAPAISELIRQAVASGDYVTRSDAGRPGRPIELLERRMGR